MAELDTLTIYNPLKEDFLSRFNGELYKVPAQESKPFPQFLAFHIAKHLSDALMAPELLKIKKDTGKEGSNAFNPRNAQLMIFDNTIRRKHLYDILGSKELVESCLKAFPFKAFVGIFGEMKDYDEYVAKKEKKEEVK